MLKNSQPGINWNSWTPVDELTVSFQEDCVQRIAFGICLMTVWGWSQSPSAFEVASIKPSAPGGHGVQIQITPGGRFVAKNVNLKFLIQYAYGVKEFQITGGPAWLSSEGFDVVAKPEGGERTVNRTDLQQMVQALLADRFKLTFHRETKELPVYTLVVAKGGSKLQASSAQHGQMRMGRGQISAQKVSISELAGNLGNQLGRNVIDRTALTGEFDFELKWTPDETQSFGPKGPPPEGAPPVDPNSPSIFTAVQEQLGLKLEGDKGPVDILIVDTAGKPADN